MEKKLHISQISFADSNRKILHCNIKYFQYNINLSYLLDQLSNKYFVLWFE